MRLVVATHNPDKLRELSELLADVGVELVPVRDWPGSSPPIESGTTLEENALIKARAACLHTGLPAVADDTGLEVEALGGQPGPMAARFAGPGCTYADNRRKLLSLLQGLPLSQRRAVFRTVACLYLPSGRHFFAWGQCRGYIAPEERGTQGFGYDPVFLVGETGLTFAQMSPEQKHALSHRGEAMRALKALIRSLVTGDLPGDPPQGRGRDAGG